MQLNISTLCDRLDKMIESKMEALEKYKDRPAAYQYIQEELLTLEAVREIVAANTSLYMNVALETMGRALMTAAERGCNGLVSYIPIDDGYDERPKVGVFNPSVRPPLCYTDEYGNPRFKEKRNQLLLHHFIYQYNNIDTIGDIEPEVVNISEHQDERRI